MPLILLTLSTIVATCLSAWLDAKGHKANDQARKAIWAYVAWRIGQIETRAY